MSSPFFEKYHVIADHRRAVGMGVRNWKVVEIYDHKQAWEWGVQKGWRVVQVGDTIVDALKSTDFVENLFRKARATRCNYEIVFERPIPVPERPPPFNPEYQESNVSVPAGPMALARNVSAPSGSQASNASSRPAARKEEKKDEKSLVETAYETSKPYVASAYKAGKPIVIASAKAGWGLAKYTSKTIYNKWIAEPTPKGSTTKSTTKGTTNQKETLDTKGDSKSENLECKICLDKLVDTCFQPCGHASCCQTCACKMTNCPMCRRPIETTIKIYL